MKQKSIFFGAIAAFVVVFVGGTIWYNSWKSGGNGATSEETLATLDRSHAPSVGPEDAQVVIVEFLDPACETCAQFYPLVKDIMAANPGRIRLVLRWAPFHPGSPEVVAMLEAARKQDKFWPALETLLATQTRWTINHQADFPQALLQLQSLDLDTERLFADMASAEIAEILRQDVADATAMNVTATPEYFVNGRPMPSFGYQQLVQLITDALEETAR